MTANDPAFSVFWARGTDRASAPFESAFYVGKHVGEDPIVTRANETIGYLVIEAGFGSIGGRQYLAGVGADHVKGLDDGPPFTEHLTTTNLRLHLNEAFDDNSVGLDDLQLSSGTVMRAVSVRRCGYNRLRIGVRWYYSRPPVKDIEFEMDLRGVVRDVVIDFDCLDQ